MKIGESIKNQYTVAELIGGGGFGTVWRAVDSEGGKSVAIKELKDKWLGSSRMVNYFKNEFKALERLSHENTIRPIELLSVNGGHMIVMEYLGGGSLSERLRHDESLDVNAALSITVKMLYVLGESNRLRIIHRDIKPSNILFEEESFENPKLGDFGLAYLSAELLAASNLGGASQAIGTLAYMPPEQLDGKKLSIRSDIYSLGMTLYKMISGRLFFREELLDPPGIKRAICHPFREHPGRYRPEIPYWLDELIMRMIASDPGTRPGSPEEVLDVIERNMCKKIKNAK